METALLGGQLDHLDVSVADLDLGEPAWVVHDQFGTWQLGVELDGAVHVSDSEAHPLEGHGDLLIFLVVHISSGMVEVEGELSLNENAQRCAAEGCRLQPRRNRRIRCSKSRWGHVQYPNSVGV